MAKMLLKLPVVTEAVKSANSLNAETCLILKKSPQKDHRTAEGHFTQPL